MKDHSNDFCEIRSSAQNDPRSGSFFKHAKKIVEAFSDTAIEILMKVININLLDETYRMLNRAQMKFE